MNLMATYKIKITLDVSLKLSVTNQHPKAKNHGPELCSLIFNYLPDHMCVC